MAGNSNSGQHLRNGRPEGAGRAPGTPNKRTVMMEELMSIEGFKEKLEDGTFITPAVFWASILNDPNKDDNIKHEVAKAMAPYWYRKQPQVTETIISAEENVGGFTINLIKPKEGNNG